MLNLDITEIGGMTPERQKPLNTALKLSSFSLFLWLKQFMKMIILWRLPKNSCVRTILCLLEWEVKLLICVL